MIYITGDIHGSPGKKQRGRRTSGRNEKKKR